MKTLTFEIRDEWAPLLIGAHRLITQVMEAGTAQREAQNRPTDEWMHCDVEERLRHMFMHMVAAETHKGTHGTRYSLTDNTALEDYKHATMGGIIAITRLEVLNDVVEEVIPD